MRVIVTGGGTGGHIYPAIAIAEYVLDHIKNSEVLYIGSENGLENRIVPQTGIPFETISAKGLPRRLSGELFKSVYQSSKGLKEANKYIKSFKPDVVIGTGGYVCGPAVLMAIKNHIPTLIHEQNAYPGITNKLLSPFVSKVLLNYPEAEDYFKHAKDIVITGLPVRNDINKLSRQEAMLKLNLDPNKKTVLVTGGSRGARTINRAVALSLREILSREEAQLIFITGEVCHQETLDLIEELELNAREKQKLAIMAYTHDMPTVLAASDIVIGRAGATFLAEIAMCGLPGILIPYPYASENHQEYNARAVVDAGGAEMILDKELTVPTLTTTLNKFFDVNFYNEKKTRMMEMARPQALGDIVNILQEITL